MTLNSPDRIVIAGRRGESPTGLESTQVTYDVSDTAGNAAEQKTRTVRVIDTGKPIITLTGDNPRTIHFGMAYTEHECHRHRCGWMANSPAALSLMQ